jgi:signal transduction histidine kinase
MHSVSRQAFKIGWLVIGQFAFLFILPLYAQEVSLLQSDGIVNSCPIMPIAKLSAGAGKLERIRGQVEEARPGSLVIRDFSGVVIVQSTDNTAFPVSSVIDVLGFPEKTSTGFVMSKARLFNSTNGDPALPAFNTIAQIRDLSALQAARGFPVVVKGVVTYYESDAAEQLQFVQDGSAGVYVGLAVNRLNSLASVGTLVEISGYTAPGGFAPIIEAETVRRIGPAKYPSATPAPFQLLMTGAEDSQWVELNGVVRSATASSNRTVVALSTGDGIVQMIVLGSGRLVPNNFIGASIKAQGVCRTLFDDRRHLTGIGLCVPDWSQIEIKEAEVADPFQLPPRSISGLFEFHGGNYGLNRSHVRGQIILRQHNGTFFLQDDSGGILVQAAGPVPRQDWVEVVGFPALKDQLPVLQDALVQPVKRTPPSSMPPVVLSPESALNESLNGTLVTLDGRVVAHSYSTTEETVTVQFAQRLTDAIMEKTEHQSLPHFVPGSTVRFTGVYMARLDNKREIQSFQVFLRSPADAVVISVPPWWTAEHALYVFGGLCGVLLLSLAWVAGLRKQVRRRTTQLRDEIEERKRMEAQMEKTHRKLIEISRQAGMAEVATSVLHNVGNVLNSVNVSATLLLDNSRKSNLTYLGKALKLINEHSADLPVFLAQDSKGKQLPGYLNRVFEQLTREQQRAISELESLQQNIEHINEIVARQQNYARVSGVAESVKATELMEEALSMNEESLVRHHIKVAREYTEVPAMILEKHKVLQILVNLIQNAKNALNEAGCPDKQLVLRVGRLEDGAVRFSVVDNGAGIAPENLTRIFAHGFTTRKEGHGFGLHSGSLAAREMGGSLKAYSDGAGRGATFTLEFPASAIDGFHPAGAAKTTGLAVAALVKK